MFIVYIKNDYQNFFIALHYHCIPVVNRYCPTLVHEKKIVRKFQVILLEKNSDSTSFIIPTHRNIHVIKLFRLNVRIIFLANSHLFSNLCYHYDI